MNMFSSFEKTSYVSNDISKSREDAARKLRVSLQFDRIRAPSTHSDQLTVWKRIDFDIERRLHKKRTILSIDQ